jgi:branched-chain amino acid transport system ATP-binding protein
MLKIVSLVKSFGGIRALKGVNLVINDGEFVGIIGPNGSGKTTLINVVTGVYKPDSGKVYYDNKDITGLPSYKICRMGISRTYQIPQPFDNMSVLENVMVASEFCGDGDRDYVRDVLKRLGLWNRAYSLAGSLSLVEKRILEIARALATKPKLLFVDEALAGLREAEISRVMSIMRELNSEGITIVWVEHRVHELIKVARRLVVLNFGEIIADDVPEKVLSNERVIEAYLGKLT